MDLTSHILALRRYALALTRDRDRAEDLVQETLSRAIAGAAQWDPVRDLRRWLFGILHHTHVSACRRYRLESETVGDLAAAQADGVPASQMAQVELSQTMRALMALPEEQREVLLLVAVEGVSYREAAAITKVPIGTVMSRLSRARAALRNGPPQASAGETNRVLRLVR